MQGCQQKADVFEHMVFFYQLYNGRGTFAKRQDFSSQFVIYNGRRRHVGQVPLVSEKKKKKSTVLQSFDCCLFTAGGWQLSDSRLKSCVPFQETQVGWYGLPSLSHLDDLGFHQERGCRCRFPGPHANKDSKGRDLETNLPGSFQNKMSVGYSLLPAHFEGFTVNQDLLCGNNYFV